MDKYNAILIHGTCDEEEYFDEQYPSLSNSHWFPWLQKQLLMKGIHTDTPEMPNAYAPEYNLWKTEFEHFEVSENTILLGHSCGGGFLVRWLSEHPVKIKQLILVAPWLDPERSKTTIFFDFDIDAHISERIDNVSLLISDNDDTDIHLSVKQIVNTIPKIVVHRFTGKGHFTYHDLGTNEFPELLNTILNEENE